MDRKTMTMQQLLAWFSGVSRLKVYYYPKYKRIKVLYRAKNRTVLELELEFSDMIKHAVYLHKDGRQLCSEGTFNGGFMTEFFFTRFLTGQIKTYTGDNIRLNSNKQELSRLIWGVVLYKYHDCDVEIQITTTNKTSIRRAYVKKNKVLATKGFCIEVEEDLDKIKLRYGEYSGKSPRKFTDIETEDNQVHNIVNKIVYSKVV